MFTSFLAGAVGALVMYALVRLDLHIDRWLERRRNRREHERRWGDELRRAG